jgi:hypothetical protein
MPSWRKCPCFATLRTEICRKIRSTCATNNERCELVSSVRLISQRVSVPARAIEGVLLLLVACGAADGCRLGGKPQRATSSLATPATAQHVEHRPLTNLGNLAYVHPLVGCAARRDTYIRISVFSMHIRPPERLAAALCASAMRKMATNGLTTLPLRRYNNDLWSLDKSRMLPIKTSSHPPRRRRHDVPIWSIVPFSLGAITKVVEQARVA